MSPLRAASILDRACYGKARLTQRAAHGIAAKTGLQAYPCYLDRLHWHLGHCPTLESLGRIALALRVLHGNAPGVAS